MGCQPGSHENGLGGETRTPDILLPKQVRYQLRYTEKIEGTRQLVMLNRLPASTLLMVREKGLEPSRLAAADFESAASTNSATLAF